MPELLTATATNQIEVALRQTIGVALRARKPTLANVAALRALATVGDSGTSSIVAEMIELRPVTSLGFCVMFDGFSTLADNGTTVFQPTDRAGKAGRWLLTSGALTGGYLKSIRLYQGESTFEQISAKLLGNMAPSVLIKWIDEDHKYGGGDPGGIYKYRPNFEIWAASRNYRSGNEALLGSGVPAELAADPGVNKIIGDLKVILGGSNLGIDAIDFVQLGRVAPLLQSTSETLSERRFIHKLTITVNATLQNPDLDDVTPTELNLQPQTGKLGSSAEDFDPLNYVVSGLTVAVGSGLTQDIAAGAAYVTGEHLVLTAHAIAFAANSASYRDLLPGGTWAVVAVAAGVEEPPITATALRVGVTVTDTSNVVDDIVLAAVLDNVGSPIVITQ